MSLDDSNQCDRDERTIFCAGLSEKVTEKIVYELFLQAGPIERCSIPKDKEDGKNKNYGFITYKHMVSVPYAKNIFAGTKLFGREIILRSRSRDGQSIQQSPSALQQPFQQNPLLTAINSNMMPQQQLQLCNAQFIQEQIMRLSALATNLGGGNLYNANVLEDPFPSARNDSSGSHRDRDLVDRNRYHRDEGRNRNKPYKRSRSRSPPHRNARDRSPGRRNRDDRSPPRSGGYHRWNVGGKGRRK